jgi:hypothetical protein
MQTATTAPTPMNHLLRIFWEPSAVWRTLRRMMPNVIHVGYRSTCTKIGSNGRTVFCKKFRKSQSGMMAFARECLADDLFSEHAWKLPILERGEGWLHWPLLPEHARLDRVAPDLDKATKLKIAQQAIDILREIHQKGYAHRDFHAENMFWVDGQLIVTDFEWLEKYPRAKVPPFAESYDLTGKGLPTPGKTGNCHFDCGDRRSLRRVLGVTLDEVINAA